MILSVYTFFHVALSLIGIGSGLVVMYGLLASKWLNGWIKLFLTTTIATSVTGFFFPFHGFTPGYALGIMSLIVLAIASMALYHHHLAGAWRRTFVITSVLALYFNFFVLVVQLFEKVPALHALAPTQSEPPFQMAQLTVLVVFLAIGIRATMKFHSGPSALVKA